MLIEKILYRTQVKATAGRDIRAVSVDGVMDLKLTMPRELGGTSKCGINPEQLFAASYAACFLGMMKLVARCDGTTLPADTTVEASVGVGTTRQGFGIEVELRICLPGLSRAEADSLVEQAHAACPYSNATRDNASVRLVLA
ncbi:MAG TPA: organic hydroperoxide resistance protein [Steroidobacteraceae bacterium]|jgi:Ohr subfamily peroxiredoxin